MCMNIKETKIPHEITIKAYISLTSALLTSKNQLCKPIMTLPIIDLL